MELMDLYKRIEELGFELVLNPAELENNTYRDKQFELLHEMETNIACYKAELRKYDDKKGIIR